ncbi:C-C chemokine receptor type 4-like [Rhinatrema bivittatum]|uniref:C-C chemokine receptor type 4-like n=1 Tax=Rhinatrema bivittatum TaxID=194408 RepID=UPI00112DB873|nr:C-C chemokine receptor type 4-like [Rhinatrema bivittatum]
MAEDSVHATTFYYDYDESTSFGQLIFLCDKEDVLQFGVWFLPGFYSLVFTLSLVGNGLVLCVLLKYENMRNATTVFILNLACSDLVFTVSLPFWAVYHSSEWIFGDALCKVLSGAFFIGFYSSIMFLTVMAIDRFLAVVYATTVPRARKAHYAIVTSITIWSFSVVIAIPEFLFSGTTKVHTDGSTLCEHIDFLGKHKLIWSLLQLFLQTVLFFLVPFSIISFCYCRIMKTLIRCRTERKHRALKVIFSITLVFFFCWAPYTVVVVLKALQDFNVHVFTECEVSKKLDYAWYVTRSLAYFHSCFNPVLYSFVGTEFQRRMRSLFLWCGSPEWGTGTDFRPRIFSHSSAHSTRDISIGSNRARISTIV